MVTPSSEAAAADPEPLPRQIAVYRKYLTLQSIAEQRFSGTLAGRLVLCIGFGQPDAELALASTIAGGTFLGIEPDPQRLKAAVRNGSCDFMVNTLDEALRVLKNELRKRAPLSVGLLGHAGEILPAMVERGVQPDLIASATSNPVLATMVERGAQTLPEAAAASQPEEVTWTTANPQDMRRMDQIAVGSLPDEDNVRRRWLEQAPASFHRQTPLQRVLYLNTEERQPFLETCKASSANSPFQAQVTVEWRNPDGASESISL